MIFCSFEIPFFSLFLSFHCHTEPNDAPIVEEVQVESALNIRNKPQQARQRRNAVYIYPVNELIIKTLNRYMSIEYIYFAEILALD